MNPTDKASLSIVGVSLFLIIMVGFFFQEKGIFGIQNSTSYLIVTISIEEAVSGETNIVVYEDDGENKLKKRAGMVPVQRPASPAEIANLLYWLSSDQNTYITLKLIL